MIKWEYLRIQRWGTSFERDTFSIYVRRDGVDALVQHLQGAPPKSRPRKCKINQGGTIEVEGYPMREALDVLGEAGWEAVDDGLFKRPREG